MTRPIVVILSTADYDAPVWTNKQHIARRLASFADVYYINSIGLRAPSVNLTDVKRLVRKLISRRRGGRASSEDGVRIVDPLVLPFHRLRLARMINRSLLALSVRKIPIERAILWSFAPLTYGLERRARKTIYQSVDLLHTIPGIPSDVLLEAEATLIDQADVVIASSAGVESHLKSLGRSDVKLWHNVADTLLYSGAVAKGIKREPRAIFGGNLTSTKVDFKLLESLAASGVKVALAGPVSIDGSRDEGRLEDLLRDPRVSYLGNLRPDELAIECARSMVGLIPYIENAYTAGVFPMKLFEYLAAGLVVVSTPIQSLRDAEFDGLIVCNRDDFLEAVRGSIESFNEEAARARQGEAMDHSWEARIAQVAEIVRSSAR